MIIKKVNIKLVMCVCVSRVCWYGHECVRACVRACVCAISVCLRLRINICTVIYD